LVFGELESLTGTTSSTGWELVFFIVGHELQAHFLLLLYTPLEKISFGGYSIFLFFCSWKGEEYGGEEYGGIGVGIV